MAKVASKEFEAGIAWIESIQFPLDVFKVQPVIPALIPIRSCSLPSTFLDVGPNERPKVKIQINKLSPMPINGKSAGVNPIPNPSTPFVECIEPFPAKRTVAPTASPCERAIPFKSSGLAGMLEDNRNNMIAGGWRVATVGTVVKAPEFEHRENYQITFFHSFFGGVFANALGGICWNRNASKGDGQRSRPSKSGIPWFRSVLPQFVGSSLFDITRICDESLTSSAMVRRNEMKLTGYPMPR